MNLVREYIINEKFTDSESDPIKDMSIGLYAKRNFSSYEDIAKFMIKFLPTILGLKKIPKDIIKDKHGYYINYDYHDRLDNFLYDYISLNGKPINKMPDNYMTGCVHQRIYAILKGVGYEEAEY